MCLHSSFCNKLSIPQSFRHDTYAFLRVRYIVKKLLIYQGSTVQFHFFLNIFLPYCLL